VRLFAYFEFAGPFFVICGLKTTARPDIHTFLLTKYKLYTKRLLFGTVLRQSCAICHVRINHICGFTIC
jgi:hypothetical protein